MASLHFRVSFFVCFRIAFESLRIDEAVRAHRVEQADELGGARRVEGSEAAAARLGDRAVEAGQEAAGRTA